MTRRSGGGCAVCACFDMAEGDGLVVIGRADALDGDPGEHFAEFSKRPVSQFGKPFAVDYELAGFVPDEWQGFLERADKGVPFLPQRGLAHCVLGHLQGGASSGDLSSFGPGEKFSAEEVQSGVDERCRHLVVDAAQDVDGVAVGRG